MRSISLFNEILTALGVCFESTILWRKIISGKYGGPWNDLVEGSDLSSSQDNFWKWYFLCMLSLSTLYD